MGLERRRNSLRRFCQGTQRRLTGVLFCLGWIHADLLSAAASLKFDHAGHVGEQSMVLPQTDVEPWKELRASLAHDDRPGLDQLAAKCLDAQILRIAVPTVPGRSAAFVCCHDLLPSSPSRMLKKSASFVLATLRGLTVQPREKSLSRPGSGRADEKDTIHLQDTAGSPSRRRTQTWRSFFIAPCAWLRPRWVAILNILQGFPHVSTQSNYCF